MIVVTIKIVVVSRLKSEGSGLRGLEFQPQLQCQPTARPSVSCSSVGSRRFSSSKMGTISVLSSEGSCPDHLEDPSRELSTLPGTWESLVSVGHIVVNECDRACAPSSPYPWP